MHLKVCVKLKNPKNPLVWAKKPKKKQKTQKTPKNPKKPTGLGFFQPCPYPPAITAQVHIPQLSLSLFSFCTAGMLYSLTK
jgi:hypothetical protein